MNFRHYLATLLMPELKASEGRMVSAYTKIGQAISSPPGFDSYVRQGYARNVMVYRCVSQIARSVGELDWVLYSKGKGSKKRVEIESHDLLTLLNRPNPLQGKADFFEALMGFYLLAGNSYIEGTQLNNSGPVQELYTWRPDRISIIPDSKGFPAAYVYKDAGREYRWNVDFVNLKSAILHMKTFNPTDLWYGQSILRAGLDALDQNNEASTWNLALLQNSATPSGVLQVGTSDSNPDGILGQDQYNKVKASIDESWIGSKNAGRPLLLEGNLKWQSISISPKDMEFMQGKSASASDIALIFGVPLEMLGLGQKTFANYAEARLSFYEETILPHAGKIKNELNRWLVPSFGDNLELDINLDNVSALSYKRDAKMTSISNINYLTINEKREAIGYEPKEGCDVFVLGSIVTANPSLEAAQPEEDPDSQPQDETETEDPVSTDDNSLNQDDGDDEDQKQFKVFNLLNANEKRKSWRLQNARRIRLEGAFEREVSKDLNDMAKALAGAITQDAKLSEFAMAKVLDSEMTKISNTLKRNIKRTLEAFGFMIFVDAKSTGLINYEKKAKAHRKYDDFVSAYVNRRTANAITEIKGTTEKKVRATVRRLVEAENLDGEGLINLAKELQTSLTSLTPARAMLIARTEVGAASSNGSLEAVKALEIPNMVKEWVSADDERVRDDDAVANHAVMNGVEVPLDAKFDVPPDASMECPGDPTAGPEQICNCRCVTVYRSKN